MLRFLPLVWSGIWRRPGRAALAALQVLLAFTLFGLLQGWQSGMMNAIARIDADLLNMHPRGSFGPLPRAYFERLQQVPGVRRVNLNNYFMAAYQNPKQAFMGLATLPRNWAEFTTAVVVPPAAITALEHTRTGAIVGDALMRKYGWKVGQALPVQTGIAQRNGSTDWTFDIVGVLRMRDPAARNQSTFIVINNDYYNEARVKDKGMVFEYDIKVRDPKQADEVASAIDQMFMNSSYPTQTEPTREMAQQSMRSIGDVNLVIRAVIAAVLFSLLFSVGALLTQSVRERTGELAVLKTVGYSDRAVMALLMTEAALLCLVSAALGLAVSWILFWIAERTNFWSQHIQLTVPVVALGAGLALLLAVVSALLPAWRGLRLPIARAMAGN
jgi:putative ABC transport system permease protein